jgi:hypothetical protein
MKTNIIRCLAVVAAVCTSAWAQQKEISEGLVSTGRVLAVSKETGDVTLRSEHAAKTLVFRGLQATPVYFATGRRGAFADIEPGQPATIYYSPAGRRWLISKIVIPDPEQSQRSSQALTTTQSSVPPTRTGGRFHTPRVPNTMR